MDVSGLEAYQLANEIQKRGVNGIPFLDINDGEERKDMWSKLALFLPRRDINLSPAPEARSKVQYHLRLDRADIRSFMTRQFDFSHLEGNVRNIAFKNHINDTLLAGGAVLTKHCSNYDQFAKQELLNDWCLITHVPLDKDYIARIAAA